MTDTQPVRPDLADLKAKAEAARDAIRSVVHEAWQLLEDSETGADGTVTVNQERFAELNGAMSALTAMVPECEGPFWGGFPANYLWPIETYELAPQSASVKEALECLGDYDSTGRLERAVRAALLSDASHHRAELTDLKAWLRAAATQTKDCSVCDGDGEVQRRDPPYGLRPCGGCEATGKRGVLPTSLREDILALIAEVERRGQGDGVVPAEPYGWVYEKLAPGAGWLSTDEWWPAQFTRTPPNPETSRNVTTLYAAPPASAPDLARVVEALRFYADPISYAVTQAKEPRSSVHADNGRQAAAILAEIGRGG